MFVRDVLAVVHGSDTLLCLGSGFASATVLKKQFESSCFRSRAGIIKRF